MELSNTFVCLMGLGTVFVGLICIILLCMLMSKICQKFNVQVKSPIALESTHTQTQATIPNRQEWIAAVSAVIAEELGTDVSAIRILSVKQI